MKEEKIISDEKLYALSEQVAERIAINTKEILTSDEAAIYLGISKSCLYKLTWSKNIPYYKPNGKLCFFKRVELNNWIEQNRCATASELADEAQEFCQKGDRL